MFTKILVAVDFSGVSEKVLEGARRIAHQFNSKTWVLHVATPEADFVSFEVGPTYLRDAMARKLRSGHRQLQTYCDTFTEEGLDVVCRFIRGVPAREIIHEAGKIEPDLIVLGSHGHGALHHLLMGSVAEKVLKNATCPVLIVPAKAAESVDAAAEAVDAESV